MSESREASGEACSGPPDHSRGLSLGVKLLIVAVLLSGACAIAFNSDAVVAYRIERAGLNRDVESLITHTSRKNPKLVVMATGYLVEIGNPRSFPVIESLISHPDRAVRRKAIKGLATLLKEESVPKLLRSVEHSDRGTRLAALESIGLLIGARFDLEDPGAPKPGDLETIQTWIRSRR